VIVSFSIDNNYKENVWCDVIPMDTCHIHPRRHWQYDHHALFDGFASSYTFVKDVIKIKLAPLLLNEFNEGKKKFKPLELLVTKELFKDKTKSCLLRLVPKSPFENVGTDFVLRILWTQQQNDSKVIVKDIFSTQGRMIENDEE